MLVEGSTSVTRPTEMPATCSLSGMPASIKAMLPNQQHTPRQEVSMQYRKLLMCNQIETPSQAWLTLKHRPRGSYVHSYALHEPQSIKKF